MAVIFYNNVGMLGLYHLGELPQKGGLTNTSHILQAYLGGAGCYLLVGQLVIIL